jgi:hypothetical protein
MLYKKEFSDARLNSLRVMGIFIVNKKSEACSKKRPAKEKLIKKINFTKNNLFTLYCGRSFRSGVCRSIMSLK